MPPLTWYLRRFQTMSARELAWRAVSGLREAVLWGRVNVGLEPNPCRASQRSADSFSEPGFQVSDLRVGEWAASPSDEEKEWRDQLLAQAEPILAHRLSFLGLADHDLGDPIDWNREHASGVKVPLRFAPFVDYRDYRVAGDAKVVWEPNRHHHLVVLGRAYRATGDARYASAVVEQIDSWR